MLRSWRFGSAAVALAVAIAGIWNQLVNLFFPVVALALLTAAVQDHPALRTAALIGMATLVVAVTSFTLVLWRADLARRIGSLAARLASRGLRVVRKGPVAWGEQSLARAGVGVVEVGLSGALVAFGAPNAEAVAATLLYRALTVLPTLALGLLAAATWRTHHPGESIESPSDP